MPTYVEQPRALPEECHEVYSAEMAIDNRFDGLDRRIGEMERNLRRLERDVAASKDDGAVPKADNMLKRHPYWAAVLSLLLGTGLIWKIGALIIDSEIDSRTEKPNANRDIKITKIDEGLQKLAVDFGRVSSKLDTFVDLEKDRLKKIGELTPKEFGRALPELRAAVEDATALKISVPDDVQSTIRKNLLMADNKLPSYWPAMSQFVNYQSARRPSVEALQVRLSAGSLTPCDVAAPTADGQSNPQFTFTGCMIALDEPPRRLPGYFLWLLPGTRNTSLVFRKCVVRYTGGDIQGFLVGAILDNCLFLIRVNASPNHHGQQLMRAILQSNASTIKVPS